MYRRIDKGMKNTIATIAVAALSFALLAGCGSKTVDPPAKSPVATTAAPVVDTAQEDRVAVAKAATDFFVSLTTESLAFEKSKQPQSFATFDKAFPKTLAATDLSSFKTKTHAYETISQEGMYLSFLAAKSPKVSVSDLVTIKDVSGIKVTGDKAVFKQDLVTIYKDSGSIEVTFSKVKGEWLFNGEKYDDAYFKSSGMDLKNSAFH